MQNARTVTRRHTSAISLFSRVAQHWDILLMLLPAIAFYIIFCYIPMAGIVLAFKDFRLLEGIWGSPFVGLKHFKMLFGTASFYEVLRNTLNISLQRLVFGFPAPIILAVMLNELRHPKTKRVIQTISYLPHFLSWVVLAGVFIQFLSPSSGPINILLTKMGLQPIYFFGTTATFVPTIIATGIWQSMGWGSIVYLAAISGIDPQLYESAMLDGATRLQRIRFITLPCILPTATVLLILNTGGVLNGGFDQIFNLYNDGVMSVTDIIDTYVYRRGLEGMQYSYAAAVGLFKNAVGFLFVFCTNKIAQRMGESSLW
jgi:ABC-type polysaccharide transport system, permease component